MTQFYLGISFGHRSQSESAPLWGSNFFGICPKKERYEPPHDDPLAEKQLDPLELSTPSAQSADCLSAHSRLPLGPPAEDFGWGSSFMISILLISILVTATTHVVGRYLFRHDDQYSVSLSSYLPCFTMRHQSHARDLSLISERLQSGPEAEVSSEKTKAVTPSCSEQSLTPIGITATSPNAQEFSGSLGNVRYYNESLSNALQAPCPCSSISEVTKLTLPLTAHSVSTLADAKQQRRASLRAPPYYAPPSYSAVMYRLGQTPRTREQAILEVKHSNTA